MESTATGGAAPGGIRPTGELVRLTDVQKRYGRGLAGVQALADINLHVAQGEMISVCGPSGHGKTCLLNLIGMLEPASEGSVVIANLQVSRLTEPARADLRSALVGYVFQATGLVPALTVLENVLLPLHFRGSLHGAALDAARERGAELLARIGLKTQTHHLPARLDASQCQRVAIARALMTRPRLVVADEATSRLDSGAMRMVMDLFALHQHEDGAAIVISTRDQRQLSRASRTLQLHEGRLLTGANDGARRTLRVQG
ncbi:ATP-binding cassette domain-containing protein [Massilia sp. R2A-15]|uniref:ABC transporter ATP-binding protein n=1 Tax=Massilia sp. R2A-15 TaxID=3064278 RepID=UPI002733CB83|nr:ATP-binding cassette domain-containing protein [Massilia sp. R2A-15]WLI91864.1 ATP-binding cassette domain-containing protein [Massilia sp. R2A-15]